MLLFFSHYQHKTRDRRLTLTSSPWWRTPGGVLTRADRLHSVAQCVYWASRSTPTANAQACTTLSPSSLLVSHHVSFWRFDTEQPEDTQLRVCVCVCRSGGSCSESRQLKFGLPARCFHGLSEIWKFAPRLLGDVFTTTHMMQKHVSGEGFKQKIVSSQIQKFVCVFWGCNRIYTQSCQS